MESKLKKSNFAAETVSMNMRLMLIPVLSWIQVANIWTITPIIRTDTIILPPIVMAAMDMETDASTDISMAAGKTADRIYKFLQSIPAHHISSCFPGINAMEQKNLLKKLEEKCPRFSVSFFLLRV